LGNYSVVPWRNKIYPMQAWAMPYVLGKKYKIHWGPGIDYTAMQIDLSSRWEPSDANLHLINNYTDIRNAFNVTYNGNPLSMMVPYNNVISNTSDEWVCGDNAIFPELQEFHLIVNGKSTPARTSINIAI
jgi:hypothetical protein